jgi:hypothetical protein
MKQLTFIALILTTGLFHACSICGAVDCDTDNYNGQFRIVSATDGSDLLFGPTRIYDKNLIKFYTLEDTDTTFLDFQPTDFGNALRDSILDVNFFPVRETAFMRLSDGDVDTFHISYNLFQSKCCGTIVEIANFKFNNTVDIPGNSGILKIMK